MTKRELIDEIVAINHTASPQFLARFQDAELDEYLSHLRVLSRPRLSGNAERYEKYFHNCPKAQPPRPLWRTDSERIEQILVNDPRAAVASEPAVRAEPAACALVEPPPAADQDELTSLSVSPAEREQLLAELDDAATDIEDHADQDDLAADSAAEPLIEDRQDEQGQYVPREPLALNVEAPCDDAAAMDDEDDDFLADDEDAEGFVDYTATCDSDAEQPPQSDYVPVAAGAGAPPEPAGIADDAHAEQTKTRRDEAENWLF